MVSLRPALSIENIMNRPPLTILENTDARLGTTSWTDSTVTLRLYLVKLSKFENLYADRNHARVKRFDRRGFGVVPKRQPVDQYGGTECSGHCDIRIISIYR